MHARKDQLIETNNDDSRTSIDVLPGPVLEFMLKLQTATEGQSPHHRQSSLRKKSRSAVSQKCGKPARGRFKSFSKKKKAKVKEGWITHFPTICRIQYQSELWIAYYYYISSIILIHLHYSLYPYLMLWQCRGRMKRSAMKFCWFEWAIPLDRM